MQRCARSHLISFGAIAGGREPQFELVDESQQALVAAIDRLPHEQREVLVMKIWSELTFAEIATALGISHNTAASRYRYALNALKKNFQTQ